VACRADDVAMCTPERAYLRVPVRLLADAGSDQLELLVDLASSGG